jgi:hypothetical protein
MARFLYAQRPSKHIQRRMVVDACRKLRAFAPLTEYEYVGFGAYEFVDFELCRRDLGIVSMHSIELDTNAQDRFTFNRPFAEIQIHFDRASNVLPDLLDGPQLRIVWLDYTTGISQEVLQDIGTCVRKLSGGSVLIVTVAARPAKPASERRTALISAVGAERVGPEVTNDSLAQGLPSAQAAIFIAEVHEQLTRRTDGAQFEQLFNIRYRDDQPMHTWGGLLVTPGMRTAFESARFDELEQVSRSTAIIDTTVEPLTTREVIHLNRQLPSGAGQQISGDGIPGHALAAYERLYRWYPSVPAAM